MTKTSTLTDPRVATTLGRLFDGAAHDESAFDRLLGPGAPDMAAMTLQEQVDAAAGIYMPIAAEGGDLMYSLVRAARPETVVEFGTSYGISTLYLAAAVRDNGTGRVVTTELNATKAAAARRTFADAGLDDVITLLEGDARETLAGLDDPAGFVLLDGWKALCLPVLKLLEPRLAPGTLVIADDVDLPDLGPYLDYVRDPANGYKSLTYPIGEGMEISCRL